MNINFQGITTIRCQLHTAPKILTKHLKEEQSQHKLGVNYGDDVFILTNEDISKCAEEKFQIQSLPKEIAAGKPITGPLKSIVEQDVQEKFKMMTKKPEKIIEYYLDQCEKGTEIKHLNLRA